MNHDRKLSACCARTVAGVFLLTAFALTASSQPIQVPQRFQPPTSWADLVDAVSPTVVSIRVGVLEKDPSESKGVDPMEFFFGDGEETDPSAKGAAPSDSPADKSKPQEHRENVGGSGFLISRDGLVITNVHVIEGAFVVSVRISGKDYPATIQGTDKSTDIALLQVHAGHDFPYLEMGDSDAVRVGDWLMVIGNPLNLDQTVTTGVVSAKDRSIGIGDVSFENFIQTDAAINFGNSGGPLLDVKGRVVGVATAVNWGAQNLGFAVPINTVRKMLPQLREKGFVTRGSIGALVKTLPQEQAPAFGVTNGGGVLITVDPKGSPAAAAGIRHGDVIVAVDGRRLNTSHDMIDYVSSQSPGVVVTLDIIRDGKPIRKQVTLAERERSSEGSVKAPPASSAKTPALSSDDEWWGIETAELTTDARLRYGIPDARRGALVKAVAPVSALNEQAVRPGCVITELNGQPVRMAAELEKALAAAATGSYLRLYVYPPDPRKKNPPPFFVVVQVP